MIFVVYQVKLSVFAAYMRSIGYCLSFLIILFYVLQNVAQIYSNIWLSGELAELFGKNIILLNSPNSTPTILSFQIIYRDSWCYLGYHDSWLMLSVFRFWLNWIIKLLLISLGQVWKRKFQTIGSDRMVGPLGKSRLAISPLQSKEEQRLHHHDDAARHWCVIISLLCPCFQPTGPGHCKDKAYPLFYLDEIFLTTFSFARFFRFSQKNWPFPVPSAVNSLDFAATTTAFSCPLTCAG